MKTGPLHSFFSLQDKNLLLFMVLSLGGSWPSQNKVYTVGDTPNTEKEQRSILKFLCRKLLRLTFFLDISKILTVGK